MPTGLPWDDPDSDPVGDVQAAWMLGHLGNRHAEQQRQVWNWMAQHWVVCGHGLAYSLDPEVPEWIQCRGCKERLVIATSKPTKVRGPSPSQVIVDEVADWTGVANSTKNFADWTPARLVYERMRKTDPLTRMCVEAIEKGET